MRTLRGVSEVQCTVASWPLNGGMVEQRIKAIWVKAIRERYDARVDNCMMRKNGGALMTFTGETSVRYRTGNLGVDGDLVRKGRSVTAPRPSAQRRTYVYCRGLENSRARNSKTDVARFSAMPVSTRLDLDSPSVACQSRDAEGHTEDYGQAYHARTGCMS